MARPPSKARDMGQAQRPSPLSSQFLPLLPFPRFWPLHGFPDFADRCLPGDQEGIVMRACDVAKTVVLKTRGEDRQLIQWKEQPGDDRVMRSRHFPKYRQPRKYLAI